MGDQIFWAQIIAVVIIVASYVFGAAMLYLVVAYLKHQETDGSFVWTLPRALSEHIQWTDPASSKPEVEYVPSSSRLIAFMGMGTIMILFLGVGAVSVWSVMVKGTLPELDKIGWFLGAGASMFVPYAANQIAGAIKSLAAK